MPVRITIGVMGLALALSACGAQSRSTAEPTSEPSMSLASSVVTSASPVGAPAKGDKPNRDFVVGKWGTDGDCTLAIDLRADGTSDGPFGPWTYSDGVIGFPETPEFRVNVTVVDDETMQSTNNGKTSRMTRCP